MKAAVLTAINEPLEIAEVECLPLEYGQVLVKVEAAGICGAQLQEIRGEKGGPVPHLMGHEGVGKVMGCGVGVTRVNIGDKVVMHWRKASGIESALPRYRYNGNVINSGRVTTFSELSVCSENRLTPVPEDTPDDLCAMLGCGLSTALSVVEQQGGKLGQSVLLIGLGGLGLNLMAALELTTPSRVCACDIHESKRRRAEIHGVEFVNMSKDKIKGEFDLILDTAGNPGAMETALGHLAPSGSYVMIGQPPPGAPVCIKAAKHLFDGEGKTIRATQAGGFEPHLDIPRYLGISQHLPVHNIITHRIPLDEINRALDLVRAGEAGRILLTIP